LSRAQQIIVLHQSNPTLTSGQIAKIVGCGPGQVVATFKSANLKLPNAGRINAPILREREACAQLAETMGAPDIARAILERPK